MNNNNNDPNPNDKLIDKLIDKFWNEDIYLAHPDYIHNEKIKILITWSVMCGCRNSLPTFSPTFSLFCVSVQTFQRVHDPAFLYKSHLSSHSCISHICHLPIEIMRMMRMMLLQPFFVTRARFMMLMWMLLIQ